MCVSKLFRGILSSSKKNIVGHQGVATNMWNHPKRKSLVSLAHAATLKLPKANWTNNRPKLIRWVPNLKQNWVSVIDKQKWINQTWLIPQNTLYLSSLRFFQSALIDAMRRLCTTVFTQASTPCCPRKCLHPYPILPRSGEQASLHPYTPLPPP
jgi:hypothetical protein